MGLDREECFDLDVDFASRSPKKVNQGKGPMAKALRAAKVACLVVAGGFSLVGFGLTAGFLAIKFGLTNTGGRVDLNDRYFQGMSRHGAGPRGNVTQRNPAAQVDPGKAAMDAVLTKLAVVQEFHPDNARLILEAFSQHRDPALAGRMIEAMELYLKGDPRYQERLRQVEGLRTAEKLSGTRNVYPWMTTEDWVAFRGGVVKDRDVIAKAAEVAGVEPRLVVTMMVSEQMRLFHSEREIFKSYFAPLKMLGNETKFSLGVCGVKDDTGKRIEANLKTPSSPCYLGPKYEHILDYGASEMKGGSLEECRYRRLTDRSHYHSYLYTALFIRQIQQQWKAAGFDLSERPEILATLFNIGFSHSTPKGDPQVGGTAIKLGGKTYTFGSFAFEFYYSGDLANEFPYATREAIRVTQPAVSVASSGQPVAAPVPVPRIRPAAVSEPTRAIPARPSKPTVMEAEPDEGGDQEGDVHKLGLDPNLDAL